MTGFLPLTRPGIDEETIATVADVLRSGWLTTGQKCSELEAVLSERAAGRPVRLVNSATAALEIGLRIAGVGPGDEVITSALTWVATANVIVQVGAKPVFVDINPATRLMDTNLLEAHITPRTRAIMPVDLAGFPVDRDRVYAMAKRFKLRVIEDAAQSQGSCWKGRPLGSFGDMTAFSFHPNKNMTTGEGGCLVMNNEDEARQFEKYRLQGVTRFPDGTYDCDLPGGKANLTDIAAAIGLGQIKRLDAFNQKRRELAKHYFEQLQNDAVFQGLALPPSEFEQANWHMFQLVLAPRLAVYRPQLIAGMKALDIATGVHYPAVHQLQLFKRMNLSVAHLIHTEAVSSGILTLPLFPEMEVADILRVCDALKQVLGQVQHKAGV
ncbi:MAG: DegT/DnrJ/EryC1/StrS aminotransferase family protein [Burkholderiales bacterium]|jgi:dTDP-4-amino-4,6-dideoxygalactose transaminase|nr:DegT/DnrJ/EryC1/StrS aminotransferase family protein [Burkholderiales bacterium]